MMLSSTFSVASLQVCEIYEMQTRLCSEMQPCSASGVGMDCRRFFFVVFICV